MNDFANRHGISLTSEEVVKISDTFSSGGSMADGGGVGEKKSTAWLIGEEGGLPKIRAYATIQEAKDNQFNEMSDNDSSDTLITSVDDLREYLDKNYHIDNLSPYMYVKYAKSMATGGEVEWSKGTEVYTLENYTKNPYATPQKKDGIVMSDKGNNVEVEWLDGHTTLVNKRFLYKKSSGGSMATGGGVGNEVNKLLSELKNSLEKKDFDSFNDISEKIHEISDGEGLSKSEYEVWDDLREKERQLQFSKFGSMATGGEVEKYYRGGKYDRGDRPSPRESATLFMNGYRRIGQDGNYWVIVENMNGVKRWQRERHYAEGGMIGELNKTYSFWDLFK